MKKKLIFDISPDCRLKRAKEAIAKYDYIDAMSILSDVIFLDNDNREARLLAADIYNEILQYDYANQHYFQLMALGDRDNALNGLISNFLRSGNFSLARYYNETYDARFDFSQLLGENEEEYFGENLDGDETPYSNLKLVVSRKEKGGENTVEETPDFLFDDNFDFGKILENLVGGNPMETVGADLLEKPKLKQVYPMTDDDCTTTLNKGIKHFMAQRYDLAVSTLDKIIPKNAKFYSEAQKYKAMCFLAQSKYIQMRECIEGALKVKPDDFNLKCYYAISLKLLEENELAFKVFDTIKGYKTEEISELMNMLDVNRLFSYHIGVFECSKKILDEFSFNNIFWLQNIKALYNIGKKKEAEYSVNYLLKLFPSFWEAHDVRYRIKYFNDTLEYGDGSFMLSRSLTQGRIEKKFLDLQQSKTLFETSYDRIQLRYALSGADDSPQKLEKFFARLQGYPSNGMLIEMKNVLLDNRTASEVKINAFFVLYTSKQFPIISLVTDNVFKEISNFELPYSDNLPKTLSEAYGFALADIMIVTKHHQKYIEELKKYMKILICKIDKLEKTSDILISLSLIKNVRILAKALMEKINIKIETAKRKGLAEIKSNLMNRYKMILLQLEEK